MFSKLVDDNPRTSPRNLIRLFRQYHWAGDLD